MTASGTGEPGDCRQQKQQRTARSRTAPSQQDRGTHKKCLRILEFAMHSRLGRIKIAHKPAIM
jgi:hypothetical protein